SGDVHTRSQWFRLLGMCPMHTSALLFVVCISLLALCLRFRIFWRPSSPPHHHRQLLLASQGIRQIGEENTGGHSVRRCCWASCTHVHPQLLSISARQQYYTSKPSAPRDEGLTAEVLGR
ncbi:unnamed protein product, partial [Ectocarpus sp. 12 AP-2014]